MEPGSILRPCWMVRHRTDDRSAEFASPGARTPQAAVSREQTRCVSVQTWPQDATTFPAVPQLKANAINIIIWILVGGLLGLSACKCAGIRNWNGIILNIAVGIGGIMLCGWLLGGFIGSSAYHLGIFSVAALLVSLLGASVLLAAMQLLGGFTGSRAPRRLQPASALLEHPWSSPDESRRHRKSRMNSHWPGAQRQSTSRLRTASPKASSIRTAARK